MPAQARARARARLRARVRARVRARASVGLDLGLGLGTTRRATARATARKVDFTSSPLTLTPSADVEHVLTEVTNIVLGVMMGGGLTLETEPQP